MTRRLLDPKWQPGWKTSLKVLLGGNLASVIAMLRLGPTLGMKACVRGFDACDPLQAVAPLLARIPEVSLMDLIGDRHLSVKLDVQRFEDGMLPMEHALALLSLAVMEQPAVVLEIGTFCGHTTKLLAQNLATSVIHTVDLPIDYVAGTDPSASLPKDDFHLIDNRAVGREYRNQSGSERIVQHFGDTALWDFSAAKDASFFFIDGSHTYEYAKNDSEKCLELCKGKGVFLWHDCGPGHPGVVRLLSEWRQIGRPIVRIQGTTLAYLKTD